MTSYEVLAELDLPEAATAVATDAGGRARLWAYRERHTEAISALGIPHKLDVTLPLSRLAEFEARVREVVADAAPGSTLILFGHLGDGNLHVNVVGPAPDDEAVDDAVLHLVAGLDGSISAEHGIGRAKVSWLGLSRPEAELAAMRTLKSALDPHGLLNPGVLLGAPDPRSRHSRVRSPVPVAGGTTRGQPAGVWSIATAGDLPADGALGTAPRNRRRP